MLDRAPYRNAAAVGSGQESVRFDGEVGDHREGVRVLDDEVRLRGVEVAPGDQMLPQYVRASERIVRAQARVLDERRSRIEGAGDGEYRGQLLELDPHQPGRLRRHLFRLGGDDCQWLAVVLDLARRQDWPVVELRPEARHRLRQVRRGHDESDAGQALRSRRVDRDDPGVGAVDRHQLRVEHVREPHVGDVLLRAGDALLTADPARGRADLCRGHRGSPSATATTASMIWK